MCENVLSGFFYKDCNLYVGEYILPDTIIKGDDLEETIDNVNKKNDASTEISKNLSVSNKKKEEINKEKNVDNDNKSNINIILHGRGKYIKKNEIFVGIFEKNMYRRGIWISYKNIHNLFFYMNIHEMILKEEKNKILENFKNLLYVPLKEINIYIGEFDKNMFNGFSFYYFYPFLYVGYFVNNLMNGYGYIFYIESINKKDNSKRNYAFSSYNLFDFLFENEMKNEKSVKVKESIEEKKEKKVKEENIEKIKKVSEQKDEKVELQNDKNKKDMNDSGGDDNLKRRLLFNDIYEKLENMVKERQYKESIKSTNGEIENSSKDNLLDKIENDIYKNFKLQIKKKNKINKIKKILNKNEIENFFDIFNYITYDNLIFKGFFYNNKFSSNANEQLLYKNMFIEMYKDIISNKIEVIKNNIMNNLTTDDLHISEYNDIYLFEKKKKMNLKKKKNGYQN